MSTHPLLKAPLLYHLAIETPAALSFIFKPSAQLASAAAATPEAVLILRSYGGLLLSTNLLCAVFLARPGFDSATALVSLCLGSYHVWPLSRAWVRLFGGMPMQQGEKEQKVLGGPGVHLVVHLLGLVALVGAGLVGLS
ncbi:hypothetical protein B0H63DRAFT_209777 [Podospora didyma]|uniref:Uncharacterized protein n=1 Tax=Podospora didyma TaxID=330526 RepID=A0AAE0TW26_9PEZI|nr:hypothetical protein B0H63DRAFT_209777 [Podospora didyma]